MKQLMNSYSHKYITPWEVWLSIVQLLKISRFNHITNKKSVEKKVLTAERAITTKIPHRDMSLRQIVLTAKYHTAKYP